MLALALVRGAPGVWWRGLALSVLLLALANPSLVREERDPLNDVVLVIEDQSPSQGIEARRSQTERAVAHLLEELDKQPDSEVRRITAGAGEDNVAGDGTELFAALREALSKVAAPARLRHLDGDRRPGA